MSIRTLDDCYQAILKKSPEAVSWLKDNNYEAYFFGLGFVQIKMTPQIRLHFYHKDLPAFVENPHDHRYSFVSSVFRGKLETRVWEECSASTPGRMAVEIEYASCQKDGAPVKIPDPYPAFVEETGFFTVEPRSSYYINPDTFHAVRPDFDKGPCITMLERGDPQKEFARVLKLPDYEEACPFSRELTPNELWDVVNKCITA